MLKEGFNEDDLSEEWDLVLPTIQAPFVPYKKLDPIVLKGRNIQVIVKLANIYLVSFLPITLFREPKFLTILKTPEKPSYPGGSWHIEGMLNEAIVSTGIYYDDAQNIAESSLAFRMGVHAPMMRVEQYDYKAAKAVFGISVYVSLA